MRCKIITATGLIWLVQLAATGQVAIKTGLQSLPGSLPQIAGKVAVVAYDFDLAQEQFFVSVPRRYTGAEPYGLFVFLSPAEACVAAPPGWGGVLESKKLIFIAPQMVGNNQFVSRRVGLAVVAACKLKELFNIDPKRVYVAGFSGGARMASFASFAHPDLFAGTFANCGADFCRKVEAVAATEKDEYGYSSIDPALAQQARENVRFVLVTGSKDFRHGNILDIYKGGYLKDGYQAKLFDTPGMGHDYCSPKILSDGLVFLDARKPPRNP